MQISLVVAASANNVIGVNGRLPWRLPGDLRHFKKLTMGKPVVMGRLTWESIGRALPGRRNIVISRSPDYIAEGGKVVTSPAAALAAAGEADEVMIIGGGQVYELFRAQAQRLYLTRVDVRLEGDAFFAPPEEEAWYLTRRDPHPADDANQYAYEIRTYERRGRS